MHKIIGRSDDMLKIRGVNVFPSQVESALIGITQISPHYQLVVRREGYADTLEVRVELIDGTLLERYGELESLQDVYKRQVLEGIGFPVISPLTEQLLMGAPLGDPAVLQDQDLVRILDG